MIDDIILIFFIILVLTFVFEDVMIPQFALLGLVLIQIIDYVPTMTIEKDMYIVILYIINALYIMYRVVKISQYIHNNPEGAS